ncbi:MAG: peptidylprolyl isomerase [Clostridia bacterium]|nr:peptidylprolyl isomerase [Clostridia bacterium]
MTMKKIIALILIVMTVICFASCEPIEVNPGKNTSSNNSTSKDTTSAANSSSLSGPAVDDPYANTVKIKIDVKDFGVMTLELYPDVAPKTVENFLSYVDEGFYNGLTFHRIYKGFMIQGGDPTGTGSGDGGKAPITGEFSTNGYNNPLSHQYGVISMARTTDPNSATCQFFICNADASASLDGKYAAFGKLIDGADVLDAISDVEVDYDVRGEKSKPVDPPVINSITRAD